jgi:integrase
MGNRQSKSVGKGPQGKRAAEAASVQLQARFATGDLSWFEPSIVEVAPEPAVPTFAGLTAEWLGVYPAIQGVQPNTVAAYRSCAEQHLVPFFGPTRVSEITPATVESFVVEKLGPRGSVRHAGRPLARPTLRVALVVLRLILQRAVSQGYLAGNPASGLRLKGQAGAKDGPDPFSLPERQAIIDTALRLNPDFAALLRVWCQTGMRAGEVTGLQQQDLDMNAGTALVRRSLSKALRLGPTKTGKARVVSLLHPTLEDTGEWRPGAVPSAWAAVEGIRGLRVRSLVPEAFVFTRSDGRPVENYWLNREWKRIVVAAGVRYRPAEQLRHTWASTLVSRGANILYVQEQGGWTSADVPFRYYTRWLPQGVGGVRSDIPSSQVQPQVQPRLRG